MLKTRAFVCKKVANDVAGTKTGQVTWSLFANIGGAWQSAKQRSGFDIEAEA